jgi:hypothetical protein
MGATLEEVRSDEGTRKALGQFFLYSSAYIVGKETADPQHGELAARWSEQRVLDEAIGAIAVGHDHEAVALAAQFAARPSIFVGIVLLLQLGTDPNPIVAQQWKRRMARVIRHCGELSIAAAIGSRGCCWIAEPR